MCAERAKWRWKGAFDILVLRTGTRSVFPTVLSLKKNQIRNSKRVGFFLIPWESKHWNNAFAVFSPPIPHLFYSAEKTSVLHKIKTWSKQKIIKNWSPWHLCEHMGPHWVTMWELQTHLGISDLMGLHVLLWLFPHFIQYLDVYLMCWKNDDSLDIMGSPYPCVFVISYWCLIMRNICRSFRFKHSPRNAVMWVAFSASSAMAPSRLQCEFHAACFRL